MATRNADSYERSAAGLDFDFPFREKAASLGQAIAENGPEAFFDEIEGMVPDAWKEHISSFPLAAVLVGFGVGIFLGMKKGDELLAAGSSMISAAAIANVTSAMERATGVSNA